MELSTRWKYVLASLGPLALSAGVAYGIKRLPYGKEFGRTLVLVSGSTVAGRLITALTTKDAKGWRDTEGRYSRQVTASTGVGVASSLMGSAYDGAGLRKAGESLAVASLGGYLVGNLTWLGDAWILGENLRLEPGDLLPELYL
jgi:hypothetical protein